METSVPIASQQPAPPSGTIHDVAAIARERFKRAREQEEKARVEPATKRPFTSDYQQYLEAKAKKEEARRLGFERISTATGVEFDPLDIQRLTLGEMAIERIAPVFKKCPNPDQVANVPAKYIFKVLGGDPTKELLAKECIDIRILGHLEFLYGKEYMKDQLKNSYLNYTLKWSQVNPSIGVIPWPVPSLQANFYSEIYQNPNEEVEWNAIGALGYTYSQNIISQNNLSRDIGIGAYPVLVSPQYFEKLQSSLPDYSILTYRATLPNKRVQIAKVIIKSLREGDTNSRVAIDLQGNVFTIPSTDVVEIVPYSQSIILEIQPGDPSIARVSYGFVANTPGELQAASNRLVLGFPSFRQVWGSGNATNQGIVKIQPVMLPLAQTIILRYCTKESQDIIEVQGEDLAKQQLVHTLNRARILVQDQLLVIPSESVVNNNNVVLFRVEALWGYVRPFPDSAIFEIHRVLAANISGGAFSFDFLQPLPHAPLTNYDFLAEYFASPPPLPGWRLETNILPAPEEGGKLLAGNLIAISRARGVLVNNPPSNAEMAIWISTFRPSAKSKEKIGESIRPGVHVLDALGNSTTYRYDEKARMWVDASTLQDVPSIRGVIDSAQSFYLISDKGIPIILHRPIRSLNEIEKESLDAILSSDAPNLTAEKMDIPVESVISAAMNAWPRLLAEELSMRVGGGRTTLTVRVKSLIKSLITNALGLSAKCIERISPLVPSNVEDLTGESIEAPTLDHVYATLARYFKAGYLDLRDLPLQDFSNEDRIIILLARRLKEDECI